MADDPKPDTGDPNPPTPDPKSDTDEIDKWKALARKHEQQAKANAEAARKLQQIEDQGKTEIQKLTDRLAEAEKRSTDAEAKALRFEIATAKGVKARWLSGTTREELEAAAEEYLADHPPVNTGPAPTKPVEDLRGGGQPAEGPEPDIRKIVEAIPRGI